MGGLVSCSPASGNVFPNPSQLTLQLADCGFLFGRERGGVGQASGECGVVEATLDS